MVLNSSRAVEMSVYVVRAFVRLRDVLTSNKQLARRLDDLERKLATHDQEIARIVKVIRQLLSPPEPKRRGIGFLANFDEK
jgi:hypothetical protein